MKEFYALSRRGRAARLRQLAMAALQHYDLDVRRIRLLTNHYNGIFRIDTMDGNKFVVRVCLPYPNLDGQLRAEAAWLAALSQETDLRVPRPIPTRAGDWMVTAEVAGVPEARHCSVFSWLGGTDLSNRLTPENIARFGAFAARLHRHGAGFVPPQNSLPRTGDRVFNLDESVMLFDDACQYLLPPERRAFFLTVVDRIQAAIDHLKASGEPLRVLHGDLHRWNVKVCRGQIAAFDFEDVMLGWPVVDIGTTLYYFYGEPDFPAIRAAFQRGYTSVAPWPERYEGEVDTFIAGRNMALANTILQSPNPEERAEAPTYFEKSEQRLRALLAGEPFHLRYW